MLILVYQGHNDGQKGVFDTFGEADCENSEEEGLVAVRISPEL